MIEPHRFAVIAAVNNWTVAVNNLCASPLLKQRVAQFIPVEGFSTAAKAYNSGLVQADSKLLVFVHQDVYLPAGWDQLLFDALFQLESTSTPWGVLGLVGVGMVDEVRGRVWSTGLAREVGIPVNRPEKTNSLDELLLVINKDSGLSFDENLPGWHLYGTDVVQEALHRNLGAYIIHAPVIHNSLPVTRLDEGFVRSYKFLRRKWSSRLPIQTCCTKITSTGWPLIKRQVRQMLNISDRHAFDRLPNPAAKARELSYE